MKKIITILAVLGVMTAGFSQTTQPQDPGKGQPATQPGKVVKPNLNVGATPGSGDWENPKALERKYKLTEDQMKQLQVAYDKMEKANAAVDPKKVTKKEYFDVQIQSKEDYRVKIKEVMTKEQYELYKKELDRRAETEITSDEAANLATAAEQARKDIQNIESNPNLSRTEKDEAKAKLNRKLMEQCLTIFGKGKKHDVIVKAIKQMDDEKEKKDKAAKDKAAKDKDGKPADGTDKPKEGSGSGGTTGGSGG